MKKKIQKRKREKIITIKAIRKDRNYKEENEIRKDLERKKKLIDAELSQIDEKLMHEEFDMQVSSNEPVRDLFSPKNIRFKTQITEEQRGALSVLYHAYRRALAIGVNFDGLKNVLDEFIDFGVSLDRKSRNEFVDAHKAQLSEMQRKLEQQLNNPNEMKI